MIVYVDNRDNILWLHEDDNIKQQYMNDDNCIVVNKNINFIETPNDDNIYNQKFNCETQEVYLECIGKKPEPPVTNEQIKEDTSSTKEVTSLTSEDAVTILEYLTVLEEKIDALTALK